MLGHLISETTRKGDEIAYEYDELSRLTNQSYRNTEYTYDDANRLVRVKDVLSSRRASYSYDEANRLISFTDAWGRRVRYEYDEAGNRTKFTYPDDTALTYQYDAKNRVTQIHDVAVDEEYSFTYDVNDRRTQLTYPNGVVTNYSYDDAHRLTHLANLNPAAEVLSQFTYAHDAVGNRLTRTAHNGEDIYTYDGIDRVANVSYSIGDRVVDYVLDAVGNRTSMNDDGVVTTYTRNNLNQYTTVNGTSFTYDGNGSLTNDGVRVYGYDFLNRLTSVDTISPNSDHTSNEYDFAGRRIGQEINGTWTHFVYDGDEVIADLDANDEVLRKYVYGPGIDEVLAIKAGVDNHALEFNGIDGRVTVPDDPSIRKQREHDARLLGSGSQGLRRDQSDPQQGVQCQPGLGLCVSVLVKRPSLGIPNGRRKRL